MVQTTGQLIEVFNAKDDNIYILEEFVGILNKCMPQKQVQYKIIINQILRKILKY